jgi:hypothetical protein
MQAPDKTWVKKDLDMLISTNKQGQLQPEFKTLGAERAKQPRWS